jgi:hypothetical protein
MKGEFEKAMGSIERTVMNEMEVNNFRTALFEGLKHLLVAGNVLLHITPDLKIKIYHLDRYVVKRNGIGNIIEIITKDSLSREGLSEDMLSLVSDKQFKLFK